jgi:general secretion pathway protein F
MASFRYKAATAGGRLVEGAMDAPDRAAIVLRLQELGYLPLHVEPARSLVALPRRRLMDSRTLAEVTGQLATLMQAGLEVERALSVMVASASARPASAAVLSDLLDALRRGGSLADAVAARPGIFPPFYAGMVRAGESGGALASVLARVAEYLDRGQAMREALRSAMIYPAVLVAMVAVAVAVMVAVVVPQFEAMIADAGSQVPAGAVAVMAVAAWLRDWWWAPPLGLAVAGLALRRRLARPEERIRFDRLLLRLPVAGPLIARIEAVRLGRTLATLLTNGVPIVAALGIAADTVANRAVRVDAAALAANVEKGEGLAKPLGRLSYLPRSMIELAVVGEETGRLGAMLLKSADVLESEVRQTLQRLFALLVPAVTVLLGVVVAAVMGAVLSAMLSVYSLPS